MVEVRLSSQVRKSLEASLERIDDEVREIEEIKKELDDHLYKLEKRIKKMRSN